MLPTNTGPPAARTSLPNPWRQRTLAQTMRNASSSEDKWCGRWKNKGIAKGSQCGLLMRLRHSTPGDAGRRDGPRLMHSINVYKRDLDRGISRPLARMHLNGPSGMLGCLKEVKQS
jgi:hypothetical protein